MQLKGTVENKDAQSEVYVKKWVDYSSKYGMGYLLSNDSTGVYYNDSTKLILDPKSTYLEYMVRTKHPDSAKKVDVVQAHTLEKYPADLKKKITLVKHFMTYLEGEQKLKIKRQPYDKAKVENEKENHNLVYVKKWMKTKHAIMFRLSNRLVQTCFTDKTEILLSTVNKMVTYVNKKRERIMVPFGDALYEDNKEMGKRLRYTKEILQYINKN